MPQEFFTNGAITTLNGAINNSTTSITVAVGSVFPAKNFRLQIDSELMFCTARSSNTLTVIRASEGTSAAAHDDTVPVAQVLTAGALDSLRLNVFAAAHVVPDNVSLSADDDEFDDETFSGWTKVWAGSSPDVTVVEKNHTASFRHEGGGAGGVFISYMKNKTPSTGDWIQMGFTEWGSTSGYMHIQLTMADGATYGAGKQICFAYSINEIDFFLREMLTYNANNGQLIVGAPGPFHCGTIHMKFVYNSANNYSAYVSTDGISWSTIWLNQSYGGVGTPSWMGIGLSSWGGINPLVWNIKYVRFSF